MSEPDRSIYDALTKGIHLASSDILGFLHCDDVTADDRAPFRVLGPIQADPKLDAVSGDLSCVNDYDGQRPLHHCWAGAMGFRFWVECRFPTPYCQREVCCRSGEFDTS